jgi:hypothetical protein
VSSIALQERPQITAAARDLPRKTLCSSGVILATVTKHILLQRELSEHVRTESELFPESLTVRGLGRRQKLYVNTQQSQSRSDLTSAGADAFEQLLLPVMALSSRLTRLSSSTSTCI